MKKVLRVLKNKYVFSTLFVLVYILFIHDSDIFALQNRKDRVSELEIQIERKRNAIEELRFTLTELDDMRTLEKYAREKHLFKRADEDVFIFSFR